MSHPVQLDAGQIFSGKSSGTMIFGYDAPSEYTPAIDSNYLFHESSRDVIVWFLMQNPEPLYICGPTSARKSSLIRQIAARLNTRFSRLPDMTGANFQIWSGIYPYRTATWSLRTDRLLWL